MFVTMTAILPFLIMTGSIEFSVPIQSAATTGAPVSASACPTDILRRAPIWPVDHEGVGLSVPVDGIRVWLTYDLDETLRPVNIRPRAPEGYDAFVTASVSALTEWCFPPDSQTVNAQHAFDFRLPS